MTSTEKNNQLVIRMMEMYNQEYIKDETTKEDAFFFMHCQGNSKGDSSATIRTSGNFYTLVEGLFAYGIEDSDFAKVIGQTFERLSPVMITMQKAANIVDTGKEECNCLMCQIRRGEL